MKKNFFKAHLILISIFAAIFLSCSDDTVPSPELEKITESDSGTRSALSAPKNVVVSQGGKRSISITWDEVSKASRYYIYASNSLFENFEQVGESTKNSFSYDNLAPGATKYIKVCSVDSSDTLSGLTNPLVGTTLAQPIISDIVEVSGYEDSAVTVHWYMENAEYYRDDLQYTITCKDSEGKTIESCNAYATELSSTSFKISDLTPSSNYVYSVSAFLSSNPSVTEESEAVDAETARRLRPNPPEDLAATQGTETSKITLSFKLPEKVDVLVAAKTYNQYPLYFKIYRRIKDGSDWNLIVSHLYFDGSTEKAANFDFEDYTVGKEISWSDDSAESDIQRGVQYEYKVQSYADNTTRVITSDLSAGEATGWMAAVPTFEAKSSLSLNEEGSDYVSATVTFESSWEMFETDENWKFIVKQIFSTDIDSLESAEPTYEIFSTLSELNSSPKIYTFTSENDQTGYYQYALIIVKAEDVSEGSDAATAASSPFIEIASHDTFFFTSEVSIPNLDSFALTDGYTNKNELSWTYEAECSYSLVRKTLNSDGTADAESKMEYSDSDFIVSDSKVTFSDETEIESGKIYSYTLYATKNERKYPSTARTAKTLGTPSPKFAETALAYDSITVSWAEVQQAQNYGLALYNDGTELESYETLDSEKVAELKSAGTITYKIEKPKGYDDATISGKSLTLKITASSAVASSEGTAQVRTIGPAATNLAVSQATSSDQITVTWNQVDGAVGYILQRTRYDIPESGESTAQKTEVFYISSDKTITYGESEISDSNIMSVAIADSKVTFTDKQVEKLSSNDGYETSQLMISWGVPFEYNVLPVLSSEDVSEIKDFKINYSSVDSLAKKGSTEGFGQNVKASKADYSDKVKITWNKPYGATSSSVPAIYYKDSSQWKKCDTQPTQGAESVEIAVTTTEMYEYSVKYSSAKLAASYETMLANTLTSLGEQENVGYAFRMDARNFSAVQPTSSNETFGETIKWSLYGTGTDSRKVKPDSYTIYSKNLNNSSSWFEVATISADGTLTPLPNNKDWYDVTMTAGDGENKNSLTITPNGILTGQTRLLREGGTTNTATTGTHDGLLKVQRDYKHYYKIKMSRETENNDEGSVSFEIGGDNSVYTYRKITDDEFCKNISLIIADALYQAGIPDGSSSNTVNGNIGTFAIKHPGASKTVHWGTDGNNYQHIFKQLPGLRDTNFISGYIISMNKVEARSSVDGHTLYHLPWNEATVKHETGLPSYQGYCWFSVGERGYEVKLNAVGFDGVDLVWDCCIQYSRSGTADANKLIINNFNNDTSYNSTYDKYYTVGGNETLFYTWFPYDIGTKHESSDTSVNTSFPEYTGTWWEAR